LARHPSRDAPRDLGVEAPFSLRRHERLALAVTCSIYHYCGILIRGERTKDLAHGESTLLGKTIRIPQQTFKCKNRCQIQSARSMGKKGAIHPTRAMNSP
jgi:hypothetical protein